MTLTSAISILARVHTRQRPYGIGADDPRSFEIIVGAEADPFINPGISRADYLEAWSVVRENAGLMPEDRPQDEIDRMRRTLHGIIALDHHNHGPESTATKLARDALQPVV